MSNFHVIVVGSGGTGTYFLKEFCRFIAGGHQLVSKLTIIDGDVVEAKNMERQAFAEEDIGLNKAVVMADVLSSSFDLVKVESYSEYLTKLSDLENIAGYSSYSHTIPMIIGCVDNHACRLLLEEYFNNSDNCIYLDSANEFSTGEVIFAYKKDGKVISPCRSHYYPEITKSTKKVTEMSCEELNNVSPQHIATNMAAGNILLKEVCSILSGTSHPGMVVFDLDMYYQEFYPYKDNAKSDDSAA